MSGMVAESLAARRFVVLLLGFFAGMALLMAGGQQSVYCPPAQVAYATAAAVTLLLAPDASKAFIYFQF